MKQKFKEIHILKTVCNCAGRGLIYLPKGLNGKEVEIIFKEPLTEEEMEELRKQELKNKLTILKEKK
jgi:hypothetical protein